MTPDKKLEICQWFFEQSLTVKIGTYKGEAIVATGEGKIDSMPKQCSGVWGYGGDSIAVRVDGMPYPSEAIVNLNEHLYKENLARES
jgi:hypothetical protein